MNPPRHFKPFLSVLVLSAFPLACDTSDDPAAPRPEASKEEQTDSSSVPTDAPDGRDAALYNGSCPVEPCEDTESTGTGGFSFTPPEIGGTPPLGNPLFETCSNAELGMGGQPSSGSADGSLLIDDFEDGDNRAFGNGLSGRWESHSDLLHCETDDEVCLASGTQSPLGGRHNPLEDWADGAFGEGRDGSNALHMTGSGFELWGSGQALYFAQDNDGHACAFDGSEYAGISFWARGSIDLEHPDDPAMQPKPVEHNLLKVHVVERDVVPNTDGGECDQETQDCWDSQRARIELSSCWQKYVLPFDTLTRDGWSKWNSGDLDLGELYQLVFEVSEYQSYEVWIDDIEFYTADEEPEEIACIGRP